jgi:phage shock protein PspC (stress-responsive transcriptional regulator)
MTSTTASENVAAPRLERPRDGRMLAGVAAGIARHVNLDPTLVRIGFAVACVAGGFGVLAYVAGALLIPEEGSEKPILHAGSSKSASTIAGVSLLIVGAFMAADSVFDGRLFGHVFWTVAFLAAGTWLLLRSPGENARVSTPPTPDQPTAETRVMPPAPPPPPREPRGRSGTRLVAGVMLLVAGGLSAVFAATGSDLDWQSIAGIAVIAAGATLAVGAFLGASPWLALPPLALGAAVASLAAAGVELEGPIGDRHWAPATKSELKSEYQMAIGELDLDLRGLDLPAESVTTVRTQLGMGELHVHVPAGAEVRIDGHAGAGEVRLPGGSSDGTDVDREEILDARPGAPVIVLDAEVGFGELRVER